jgi:hypothetical protein
MPITEIYSGAEFFGVPPNLYFSAYVILMIMFLVPTLVSIGWALVSERNRAKALRLVRPLSWTRYVPAESEGRSDRAA